MTLLDRYLIKRFFLNLLLVLASLVSIYLLVDFFERVDNFNEANKPFSLAATYFLLKIPMIYDQMAPICILLAGVITLGLLGKSRELMSLNAGGISLGRIVRPMLAASIIFTLLTVAAAQWLLPRSNTRINEIWYQEVKQQIAKGIVRKGLIFHKGERGVYSLRRPDPTRYEFSHFVYTEWDDTHRDIRLFLTAERVSWSEAGWVFENGQIKRPRSGGGYDINLFERLSLDLPDRAEQFFVPAYRSVELSLSDLYRQAVHSLRAGEKQGIIDINRRFSFLFLGLPLLLVAVPLLHILQREKNRDLTLTIPISCVLAFFAWGLWNWGQSLSQAEYLNPYLASWSIHLAMTVCGLVLLWRADRR